MIVNYWAGVITPDTIQQHPRLDTWAIGWLRRAETAELQGRRLVVFEVPQEYYNEIIQGIEWDLQRDYGLLPTGLMMPE